MGRGGGPGAATGAWAACPQRPRAPSSEGASWLGRGRARLRPRPRASAASAPSACVPLSRVTAAGRKQLEAHGPGAGSVRGRCGRPAAFKEWKQQVPVIESRGMVFTHYRKPGMLRGDFYLL